MSGGADFSRTCEGCAHAVSEEGPKGEPWERCFALGPCRGYVVGNKRFLPYVPAWCPLMQEKEKVNGRIGADA